jgi:hypothetical protein
MAHDTADEAAVRSACVCILAIATLALLMVLPLTIRIRQAAAADPTPAPEHRAWLPLVSYRCLPVPSPTPSFLWGTCLNSLDDLGDGWIERGGRYRIGDDPANSGRGKVLEATAAPDLAYFDPTYCGGAGDTIARSYPDLYSVSGEHAG